MTTEKRCSACGQAFGCGRADPTCWCVDLPHLPASELDGATDCLCPNCLRQRIWSINPTPAAATQRDNPVDTTAANPLPAREADPDDPG